MTAGTRFLGDYFCPPRLPSPRQEECADEGDHGPREEGSDLYFLTREPPWGELELRKQGRRHTRSRNSQTPLPPELEPAEQTIQARRQREARARTRRETYRKVSWASNRMQRGPAGDPEGGVWVEDGPISDIPREINDVCEQEPYYVPTHHPLVKHRFCEEESSKVIQAGVRMASERGERYASNVPGKHIWTQHLDSLEENRSEFESLCMFSSLSC